jgi:hypothetical protein
MAESSPSIIKRGDLVSRGTGWVFARPLRLLVAAGLLLALAGCAGRGRIKGKVVYEDNQQPVTELAGFPVTLNSHELAVSAQGMINEDGTFQIEGIVPGHYKVVLTQNHPAPGRPDRTPPVIDVAYEDPDKSPLEITVNKGTAEIVLPVKRIKQKHSNASERE